MSIPITTTSIMGNRETVTRQEVHDFFRARKIDFANKELDHLNFVINITSAVGSAIIIVAVLYGFIFSTLIHLRTGVTLPQAACIVAGGTASITFPLFGVSIATKWKRSRYVREEIDRTGVESFLKEAKELAQGALLHIQGHAYGHTYGEYRDFRITYDSIALTSDGETQSIYSNVPD